MKGDMRADSIAEVHYSGHFHPVAAHHTGRDRKMPLMAFAVFGEVDREVARLLHRDLVASTASGRAWYVRFCPRIDRFAYQALVTASRTQLATATRSELEMDGECRRTEPAIGPRRIGWQALRGYLSAP